MQEVAEVLERVITAVADMAEEAKRTPPSARLTLHVGAGPDGERVSVQLLPDNYHDTMTTALTVPSPSPATVPWSTGLIACRPLAAVRLPLLDDKLMYAHCMWHEYYYAPFLASSVGTVPGWQGSIGYVILYAGAATAVGAHEGVASGCQGGLQQVGGIFWRERGCAC